MADNDKTVDEATPKRMDRRQFITGVGGAGAGLVLGGLLVKGFLLPDEVFAVPASDGYLLVDTKKCSGCTTCMMACSLAHTGEVNLSLARIQVVQNSFGAFPNDIEIAQCRQCPYPACVDACPTGANHVDADNGNVRTIDASKCIGCERCVEACPFTPSRALWNFEDKHAQKCDLCADTPFWDEKGGPDGKRACETLCSMRAISFTREIPRQNEDGYSVDLRGPKWDAFGFSGAGGASGGH